jgi:inner membrane protein
MNGIQFQLLFYLYISCKFDNTFFMKYKAHLVGAASTAVALLKLYHNSIFEQDPLIFIAGALVGGFLPDIDHGTSYIGRHNPLSSIQNERRDGYFSHRHFFHGILFLLIVCAAVYFINYYLAIGLATGMLSHIVLDLFDYRGRGVAVFSPFYNKKIDIWQTLRKTRG